MLNRSQIGMLAPPWAVRKLTLTLILIIPELFHKEQNGAFFHCFYAMKQNRDEDKAASRSTSAQPSSSLVEPGAFAFGE